ncbi:hypothetical protein [uncultured Ruegeria sp.]|uniref:hypothetical protein n=1 Tax=uncultured Ruegeria sp. TaxID=259304 RepID=UPI0026218559|nr:hypothetical protein [uncultured Ruegeria sp.]
MAIVDRSLMGRVADHVRQAQIIYGKDKTRHAVAQLFRDQYPDMPDHLARGLGETYVTALRSTTSNGIRAARVTL